MTELPVLPSKETMKFLLFEQIALSKIQLKMLKKSVRSFKIHIKSLGEYFVKLDKMNLDNEGMFFNKLSEQLNLAWYTKTHLENQLKSSMIMLKAYPELIKALEKQKKDFDVLGGK